MGLILKTLPQNISPTPRKQKNTIYNFVVRYQVTALSSTQNCKQELFLNKEANSSVILTFKMHICLINLNNTDYTVNGVNTYSRILAGKRRVDCIVESG